MQATGKYLLYILFVLPCVVYLSYQNICEKIVLYTNVSPKPIQYISRSLQHYLENVSDSRIRLTSLQITSILGKMSMWVALPSVPGVLPGGGWYEELWNEKKLHAAEAIDHMISLAPCEQHDKVFIQIGAHLGLYPLIATYRRCHGIAVEGIPAATNYARISGELNTWTESEFLAINAAVSNTSEGSVWFDPARISISANNHDTRGKVWVPLTTLDALNTKYCLNKTSGRSRIAFVVIDVEAHEQEVLMGAKNLIEELSVVVFEIEVWTRNTVTGFVTYFPGLELLVKNGYHLYTKTANSKMNIKFCDDLTNRLMELPSIFNESCQNPSFKASGICQGSIYALRADSLSKRQSLRGC